jgi:hypothetical protein
MAAIGLTRGAIALSKWIIGPWLVGKLSFGLLALKYAIYAHVIPALHAVGAALIPVLAAVAPFLLLAAALGGAAYGIYRLHEAWKDWTIDRELESRKQLAEHQAAAGLAGTEKYMQLPPPEMQMQGKTSWGMQGWSTAREATQSLEIPTPTPPPVAPSGGNQVSVSLSAPITITGADKKTARELYQEISKNLAFDIETQLVRSLQ